jgi:hypothetical protein
MIRTVLAALLLALAAIAPPPAAAQLLQQDPPPPIGPAGAGRLAPPMLAPMLRQLGYQTKDLGNGVQQITILRGGINYFVVVGLSGDAANLWFFLTFETDPAEFTDTAKMRRMLEVNRNIQPTHYYIVNNRFALARPMENRDIDIERLRAGIEAFMASVERGQSQLRERP